MLRGAPHETMALSVSLWALAYTPSLMPASPLLGFSNVPAVALVPRRGGNVQLQLPDIGKMGSDFMSKMGMVCQVYANPNVSRDAPETHHCVLCA